MRPIELDTRGTVNPDLDKDTPNSGSRSGSFRWLASLICILALAFFFRQFIGSKFTLIDGNLGDNRLVITILEHWRAVFHGQASFRSPNFFWPEQGVLGYSEGMFLLFLPYVVGRSIGLDPYLAFEITLIVFKAIGFVSMLWLLRSFLAVTRPVALVGAALFTISNLYFVSAPHGHLMTVALIPLLLCLGCAAWRANEGRRTSEAYIYSSLFGLLLALVLFTSFYIGWFTIFAGGLVALSTIVLKMSHVRDISPLREMAQRGRAKAPLIAVSAIVFSVAIVPFLLTYLPTLKNTGGRSFEETLFYTAQPVDLINIGQSNWMWGRLLDTVLTQSGVKAMVPSETERGWPPVTLLFFAAGVLVSARRRCDFTRKRTGQFNPWFLLATLGLACVVGWLLSIKVHELSLWWLVFKFIPGGAAIRVPARFNFVLNILVDVVVCLLLNELRKRSKGAFWVVALLLVGEQINSLPVHQIQRTAETALFERTHRPPSVCSSFFLAEPASSDRPWYANQIDAMIVARMYDLPTVDGYSGWNPAGWNLRNVDNETINNVRAWALSHKVDAGICGLDLRNGSWTRFDFKTASYVPGSVIDFRLGGNANVYKTEGWGQAEPGGSWTLGGHSVLLLNLPSTPDSDFVMTFTAHAFLLATRPAFAERIRINGREVSNWTVANPQFQKRLDLPRALLRSQKVEIEFVDEDPRSPAELGYSIDSRKLGLAIETLTIAPGNK